MVFRENAQRLFTVKPRKVARWNALNNLSIVYDAHDWHEKAQDTIDLIEPGSYAGIEKVSFDRRRLEAPFEDIVDAIPRGEMSKPHTPVFLERFARNIAYDGLNLFRLRQNNEKRFDLYKERTLEELDSVNGTMGLNSYAGYYLKLCMGLIEKDCIYAPAEADSLQLPKNIADQVRYQRNTQPDLWNDLHHYRDHVLVYNLVTDSMKKYRQILGVERNEKFPITIVRGSGHRESLNAILDESSIDYHSTHIPRSLPPNKEEIIIPTSFSSYGA